MKIDFWDFIKSYLPEDAEERAFQSVRNCDESVKAKVRQTPDKWMQLQLDRSIKDEHYELASYIKKEMIKRGLKTELK